MNTFTCFRIRILCARHTAMQPTKLNNPKHLSIISTNILHYVGLLSVAEHSLNSIFSCSKIELFFSSSVCFSFVTSTPVSVAVLSINDLQYILL